MPAPVRRAVERRGYEWFRVAGGQRYRAGVHAVEADCSQASYFWAAAAVTGSTVKVQAITAGSGRATSGCWMSWRAWAAGHAHPDGLAVSGASLSAVEVDMGDMPDVVPTLAVVAAFARGSTVIRSVAHLREKESDRLAAVSSELDRMGIQAGTTRTPCGSSAAPRAVRPIECHDDHRIAMSFAVAGLETPGIVILDESCVRKSFPTFWDVFETLYR